MKEAIFYRPKGIKPWSEGWIQDTQGNLIKITSSKYSEGTWWSLNDIETLKRKEREE